MLDHRGWGEVGNGLVTHYSRPVLTVALPRRGTVTGMEMHEAQLRAMGSDAHVIVVGEARLLGDALARIQQLERRWSRFIETSEVCELNRRAGGDMEVSADTRRLVA